MPSSINRGSSPALSFVEGTASSRYSQKRDRRRSSSPTQHVDTSRLAPAPPRNIATSATSALDGKSSWQPPPYVIKQYLAVEASAPFKTEEVEHGVLGESTEREAGYLVGDGSQLARDEVRDALHGTGVDAGERNEEERIRWRTVPLTHYSMEDIWINGRSWTYQLPPPKISASSPSIDIPAGAIIGKPVLDLPEWDRSQVQEAFSPIQTKTDALPGPGQPVAAKDPAARPAVLGSPFDSQRGTKRKTPTNPPSPIRHCTPPRRPRSPSPYVFVNDLPAWEWHYPTDSPESLRADGSQSQNPRESLRHSCDDLRPSEGKQTNGRAKAASSRNMVAVPAGMDASPQAGFTSFLTDASVINTGAVATPTNLGGQEATDGKVMRRMPVMLKDLDHVKFQQADKERKTAAKAGFAMKGDQVRGEGMLDKRVKELQVGQTRRDIRPIKEFLPLALRIAPPDGNMDTVRTQGNGGDDSIVDDISLAESTHVDAEMGSGIEASGEEEDGAVAVAELGVPMLTVEGIEAVADSPKRPEAVAEVVYKKDQLARRRILEDKHRYGALYDIIPEPHTLLASVESSMQTQLPPLDIIEPIPTLPSPNHPFHPALDHYITKSPYTRVHWVIPIHGPVIIPDYPGDEALAGFLPSSGHLALASDEYRDIRKRHRREQALTTTDAASVGASRGHVRPLIWTRELMSEMWNRLLRLRRLGRFGPIALALSSSQPDPFRVANDHPTKVLEAHKCLPLDINDTRISTMKPVRPESGDHVKLFCDLRYAMAVRCVLKGLEVGGESGTLSRTSSDNKIGATTQNSAMPLMSVAMRQPLGPTLSSTTSRSSKAGSRSYMPFRGVKLCLVGDRGEVLLVV